MAFRKRLPKPATARLSHCNNIKELVKLKQTPINLQKDTECAFKFADDDSERNGTEIEAVNGHTDMLGTDLDYFENEINLLKEQLQLHRVTYESKHDEI